MSPEATISLENSILATGDRGFNSKSPASGRAGKNQNSNTMAQEIEIKCINKSDRYSPHERIKNVGGVNPDGARWILTQEAAIAGIESGQWRFYVMPGGRKVWVIVAVSQWGNKYLKTENDGADENNLLSLPECP